MASRPFFAPGEDKQLPKTSELYPTRVSWIPIDRSRSINTVVAPGDLGLSACPGKKVFLKNGSKKFLGTGVISRKLKPHRIAYLAVVNRDLPTDLTALKSLRVSCLVCCLTDSELERLGVPWGYYQDKVSASEISILRLPMVDGGCPSSFEDLDIVLDRIDIELKGGGNTVIHCRSGVGRAGLVACCYLLKYGVSPSPQDAIQLLRRARHPKCVETRIQEKFIEQFYARLKIQSL